MMSQRLTEVFQTNLWDGLYQGLEQLKGRSDASRMPAVILLTDGQPNVIPPGGHLDQLKRSAQRDTLAHRR